MCCVVLVCCDDDWSLCAVAHGQICVCGVCRAAVCRVDGVVDDVARVFAWVYVFG